MDEVEIVRLALELADNVVHLPPINLLPGRRYLDVSSVFALDVGRLIAVGLIISRHWSRSGS